MKADLEIDSSADVGMARSENPASFDSGAPTAHDNRSHKCQNISNEEQRTKIGLCTMLKIK